MGAMDLARPTYTRKSIAILSGYENGRLDNRVLVKTRYRGLLANVVSARKFNALHTVAINAGIAISSTGINRFIGQQESLFEQRWDKGYIPGRKEYTTYRGITYSLKVGASHSAIPGRSQHGWARANDFAEMVNGDNIPDSLSSKAKIFLAEHGPKCGIYFPDKTEDWHGEDYAGDDFSACPLVLEVEKGAFPIIPPFAPSQGAFSLYPFDASKATLFLREPNFNSDLVAYLQGVMKVKLGYAIRVDGVFGPVTRDHVIWFQTVEKLKVDGVVGPATWRAIDRRA